MKTEYFTADFETTTDPDDCRVWAVGVCNINSLKCEYSNNIEWFIEWCSLHPGTVVYFHNLAFDGSFIMDYLERSGWDWVEDEDQAHNLSYSTVISDMNQVYQVELFFTPYLSVKLRDSLKVIPLKIEAMAKAFNLSIEKLELDYSAKREVGHKLTKEERHYLEHDIKIAALAMRQMLNNGLSKMTAASNAFSDFRVLCGGRRAFRKTFPILDIEEDKFIRKAYRGGFTYVNPKYQNKIIGAGIVLDVNSLYPSVMNSCDGQRLPYGDPVLFAGEPKPNSDYDLWVAQITCSFKLKKDYLPCIQLKGNFRFNQTEYIRNSGATVTFTITNVDWKLISTHYVVSDLKWHGGYYFKSDPYLFTDYIDKWITLKNDATISGNKGMRQISKLMLNSLYGKFASNPVVHSRRPVLDNDVLKYVDIEDSEREPFYLPVGVFITAYARYKTITAAQSVYDRFIYADTDSLHLIGKQEPRNLEIDNVKLGAWAHESTFTKAKFLRAKTYIEYEVGKDTPTVHVAGMPAACHSQVSIDNFNFETEYDGKLYVKRVRGGIVLIPDKMKIRK